MIDYLKQDDPKLTQGPLVQAFEEQWSEWLGVKHSIMLNSGSSANDLTMMALKELKGSGEVIVPSACMLETRNHIDARHIEVSYDRRIEGRTVQMNTLSEASKIRIEIARREKR